MRPLPDTQSISKATRMSALAVRSLLVQVVAEIDALPQSSIDLAIAMIAMQQSLPEWLRVFVLSNLAQRANLQEISPATEAMMKLSALARLPRNDVVKDEFRCHYGLLKALALDDKILVATEFLKKLSGHLSNAALSIGPTEVDRQTQYAKFTSPGPPLRSKVFGQKLP